MEVNEAASKLGKLSHLKSPRPKEHFKLMAKKSAEAKRKKKKK